MSRCKYYYIICVTKNKPPPPGAESELKMNTRKKELIPSDLLLEKVAYLKQLDKQREKSMLGQRTRFLALHRYVDNLTDEELKLALNKVKNQYVQESKECPTDRFIDTAILEDTLHHEMMIRDGYDLSQIADVVKSYRSNVRLINKCEEITSEHLINRIK